ncbi:MAG: hypothetical protein D6729_03815 [Deltaproteobacteria bacterium]|nr:MAG: hypothetical protein D6729_03815 [Deltaproteobacteria bacterium]
MSALCPRGIRRRPWRAAGLALLAGLCLAHLTAACGGPTAIVVTIDDRDDRPLVPGEDFERLRIDVHKGGAALFQRTVVMTDKTFPQSIVFTPGPESRRGVLTVEVTALDVGDIVVTRGSRDVAFREGEVVEISVELIGP